MKIVTKKETVILTAQEKAILDKAFEILEGIADTAEFGEELHKSARDAYDELEYFLDEDNNFYEVEPPVEGVSEVIVKITP